MNTLYDLFKLKEDATASEIKQAYETIIKESQSREQTDQLVEQIRRIQIAYGILSNPEKRKKYDEDLASKRADELLQNVQVREQPEEIKKPQMDEEKIKPKLENQINDAIKREEEKEQQKKLEKQKQKELERQKRKAKRQAKKQLALEREMEMNAYGKYLENQGYQVQYPWTWRRVKRLLLSIISVVLVFVILWHIPFIRKTLTDLYHENFIIKTLVDIVISILNSIKWW